MRPQKIVFRYGNVANITTHVRWNDYIPLLEGQPYNKACAHVFDFIPSEYSVLLAFTLHVVLNFWANQLCKG